MLAGMMVIATGYVFFIAAGLYVPGPSLPNSGNLTYSVSGSGDDVQFTGVLNITFEGGSSWSRTEGDIGPDDFWHSYAYLAGDYYLDSVVLNTSWGDKVVHRYLSSVGHGNGSGLSISYQGAETCLNYRTDYVMAGYRATYLLTATNITNISDMDLQEIGDTDHLRDHRTYWNGYHEGAYGFDTGWKLIEPEDGHDYRIAYNFTNYAIYLCNHDDIESMIAGGTFRYQEDLFLSGSGNVTVLLDDELYFYMAAFIGTEEQKMGLQSYVFTDVTVIDE